MEREESQAEEECRLLRNLCRALDTQRQKSQKAALEWQTFGRFTAAVLQREVEGFERKLRVLQEKLDRLAQENSELQEMCLYLDKSRGETGMVTKGHGKLPSSSGVRVPVHSICVREMNTDETPIAQYTGLTSQNTLKDKKRKRFNLLGIQDPRVAVEELQKRVEKLEAEKLELVKSLSAAHLLTTQNTPSAKGKTKSDLVPPSPVEEGVLSPEFQALLESCKGEQDSTTTEANAPSQGLNVSPDMIMQAVTLLDMCRRLDAMETTGFADPLEAAEVATLRVLMSIAWQKLQEHSKKN